MTPSFGGGVHSPGFVGEKDRAIHDLTAPIAETRAALEHWLETFARCVRNVDYASAKPMFHPRIVAFGTHSDRLPSLESWVENQWTHIWPNTSDFRFDLENTRTLISDDGGFATVVAPWDSTGYHPDQSRFDRPGRATMVLRRDDGRWVCVHSHMSLNRGVPQQSFRSR